jgi:hypothetical protein
MAPNEQCLIDTLHGFTPVQRRRCGTNAKAQVAPEKEWTTARCHRLLRALTSRVAILKKDLELLSNSKTFHDATHAHAKDTKTKARPKTGYPYDDTDWNQGKRKVKRTYSSRVGQKAGNVAEPKTPRSKYRDSSKKGFVPGEIIVPTPILNRARSTHLMTSQNLSSMIVKVEANGVSKNSKAFKIICSLNDEGGDLSVTKSLSDLRKTHGISRYNIYEGIYNGLETLLNSTKHEAPCRKRGARSLMTMCLKAVPRYIDQERASALAYEEETGTKSAINHRDVSTEIYDDLEQFGSIGHGWKPLGVVVRAHGMMVLQDAISAGLLDSQFCGILATLCVQNAANEEAESLISSLVCSSTFHAPRTLYDAAPSALKLLWKFVDGTGSHSFLYDQLTKLIVRGLLPPGWLATKDFRPVWTGVMQRLSPGFVETGVISFLDVAIPSLASASHMENGLSGVFASAVESTYSSLLTTLLSITMLSKEYTSQQGIDSHKIGGNDYKHIPSLLESSLAQYDFLYPAGNKSGLLIASALFANTQGGDGIGSGIPNDNGLGLRLQALLNADEDENTTRDDLAAFICSVARCCGRGTSETGLEYLKVMHDVLEYSGCVDVVQGLIVNSAHAFANESPKREHMEYASTLEVKYANRGNKTPIDMSVKKAEHFRSGFRWEDGIGEWVTATPVAKYNWSQNIDIEPDTPLAAYLVQKPSQQCALKCVHRGTCPSALAPVAQLIKEYSSVDEVTLGSQTEKSPEDSQQLLREKTTIRDVKATSIPKVEDMSFDETLASSVPSLIDDLGDVSETSPCGSSRASKRKRGASNCEGKCKPFYAASLSSSAQSSQENLISGSQRPHVVKGSRLRHKLPGVGQAWESANASDDSEDELSFTSTSPSNDGSTRLSGVFGKLTGMDQAQGKRRRTSSRQKSMGGNISLSEMDSADELCI